MREPKELCKWIKDQKLKKKKYYQNFKENNLQVAFRQCISDSQRWIKDGSLWQQEGYIKTEHRLLPSGKKGWRNKVQSRTAINREK